MEGQYQIYVGKIVLFRHDQNTAYLAGGNSQAGEQVPAIIVRVWDKHSGCVNLKVFTDAERDIWVTSSTPGDGQRQYQELPTGRFDFNSPLAQALNEKSA